MVLSLFVLCFFFSSRRRHTRCALVTGVQTCALPIWSGMLASTRSKFTFSIFYPFEAERFNSRGTASLRAHVEKSLCKLLAPGVGDAVRRRAPVPTSTESTSGGDLGSVWQTRAFELAGLEEARDENLEPFSDRGEIISTTFGFRKSNRPFTQFVIAPRLPGKEGDFCRANALSNDIVQKEVVQLIRTDRKSTRLHSSH